MMLMSPNPQFWKLVVALVASSAEEVLFDDLTKNHSYPETRLDPQDLLFRIPQSALRNKLPTPVNSKTNDLGDEETDRFEDTAATSMVGTASWIRREIGVEIHRFYNKFRRMDLRIGRLKNQEKFEKNGSGLWVRKAFQIN